ncbi:MAG: hypothetical protein KC466_06725 [Myxococcales bacterium]|nr:hypothetical protein [Myxococcales bacterium]
MKRTWGPGARPRSRVRAMQWDAQIERGGAIYYKTLGALTWRRADRAAFSAFARFETANARAIRDELRRIGAPSRANPAFLYAGVATGALAACLPRRVLLASSARLLATGHSYWSARGRAYGPERARLLKRIAESYDLQRDWFVEQLRAAEGS